MSISDSLSANGPKPPLATLLARRDIWRASTVAGDSSGSAQLSGGKNTVDTGYLPLNAVLLGQGWPVASLIELHSEVPGYGEWQLLLPALTGKSTALIAPPYIPYAPALVKAGINLQQMFTIATTTPADSLWAVEQVLRSGGCNVLLLWETQCLFQYRQLRKLQLAASQSHCLFVLLRSMRYSQQPVSPAVLRLKLQPTVDAIALTITKQRGSYGQCRVCIPVPDSWRALPPLSQMPCVRSVSQSQTLDVVCARTLS